MIGCGGTPTEIADAAAVRKITENFGLVLDANASDPGDMSAVRRPRRLDDGVSVNRVDRKNGTAVNRARVHSKSDQSYVESAAGGRLAVRGQEPTPVWRPSEGRNASLRREENYGVAPVAADDIETGALRRASGHRDASSLGRRERAGP